MKIFKNTINRDKAYYKRKHYRAHWQPLWAIIGFTLCTLLTILLGWAAVFDLCAKSPGVTKRDSIVDLITSYLGVSASNYMANMRDMLIVRSAWDVFLCVLWLQAHLQNEDQVLCFVQRSLVYYRRPWRVRYVVSERFRAEKESTARIPVLDQVVRCGLRASPGGYG